VSQQPLHLWIEHIHVRDLRCHHDQQWLLKSGVNMLVGENGCGKTTILEAVYMMANGRSFRQARDPELVRWQRKILHVHGTWHRYGPLHVKVLGQRRKTEIQMQGRKLTKRKELIEALPVIVDAPQGKRIIDGVNNERRKWLDQLMIQCNPLIQHHYHGFLRALMQRSRVLRKNGSDDELSVWEDQMIRHGRPVQQARQGLCEKISQALNQEKALTEKLLTIKTTSSMPESDDEWSDILVNNRQQDRRMGRCTVGPHTDKISILFDDKEIRSVGSRGQQKLAAVAIRLVETQLRQEYQHLWPVLLLDDCFEALDSMRRINLMRRLCDYPGQVLVTAPNLEVLPTELSMNILHVKILNKDEVDLNDVSFESHNKIYAT